MKLKYCVRRIRYLSDTLTRRAGAQRFRQAIVKRYFNMGYYLAVRKYAYNLKIYFLILSCFFIHHLSYAQQLLDTNYYFNSTIWNTLPYDITTTSDNHFLITGGAYLTGGVNYYSLIKTDAGGNLSWFKTETQNVARSDGEVVRELSNGNYIVGAVKYGFYDSLYILIFDTNGTVLFSNSFGDTCNFSVSTLFEINSNLFIFCRKEVDVMHFSTVIIRTDLQGNFISSYSDSTFAVGVEANAVVFDGQKFTATGFGYDDSTHSNFDPVVVQLDLNLQQLHYYRYIVQLHSNGKEISNTSDGGFVIYSVNPSILIKIDSVGIEEWRQTSPVTNASLFSQGSKILISGPQLNLYYYDLSGNPIDTVNLPISPYGYNVVRTIMKGDTVVLIEGVQNGSAPIYSSSLLAFVKDTLLINSVIVNNRNKILISSNVIQKGDYINIKNLTSELICYNLFDLGGRLISRKKQNPSSNIELAIYIDSTIVSGYYILEVYSSSFSIKTKIFIY